MTTKVATFAELRRRFQEQMMQRLPLHIGRMRWNREQIADHQQRELRRLLAHAIQNSPYHARRLVGVDAEGFQLSDLSSLPVMTKADMMANYDDVVTDRQLSRRVAEEALKAAGDTFEFIGGQYVCMASGGSSGLRGLFALNWEATLDFTLGIVRAGIAKNMAGGGAAPGLVVGAVAAPKAVHGTAITILLMDGAMGGLLRAFSIPSTLPLQDVVSRLNSLQPNMLVGYPSMIRIFAAEHVAGRLAISPHSITTTSETLAPEAREEITAAFGVPVANTFGSSEGLVGSSEPGEEAIAFATDLAIVELVDEENRPVLPGTPSAKVLVTNLYNLAQPLIRYELTDSFIQQPDAPNHGHLRATVAGRSDDVFVYGDVRVHPLAVRSPLVKTPEVVEYQVRQTPRGVDLAVVTSAPVDESALAGKIASSLAEAGLPDAEVTVRTVEAIQRDNRTGKARRFIPLAT